MQAEVKPTTILLVQLGTPDAPTSGALRRYLREFLGDPRVVNLPRAIWLPILYGPILAFRPRRSAALYRRIWTEKGSPLRLYTEACTEAIAASFPDHRVEFAMRYGEPKLSRRLAELRSQGPVLVIPLFPQYAGATIGSIEDVISAQGEAGEEIRVLDGYAEHPGYIDALAASVSEFEQSSGGVDRWLVSFHGIPLSQTKKDSRYPDQCEATAKSLAAKMGWADDAWELSYQSRVGPQAWLSPYTEDRFEELGRGGLGHLAVICPGFAADCLETIDEIGDVGAEQFQSAGGTRLSLVPCLNASPQWISALAAIIREQLED